MVKITLLPTPAVGLFTVFVTAKSAIIAAAPNSEVFPLASIAIATNLSPDEM
jgi:hypothetical protein